MTGVERIVLIAVLIVVAAVIAQVISRRTRADAPTRPRAAVPDHIDRADLTRPEAPWMVAVFSSATCTACRGTWEKARQLESDDVAVQEIEAVADAELHDRYGIDAVPLVVVIDATGAVRGHFLGEPPAAELWATVADLRSGDGTT